jgi:hypothetical protein
MFHRKFNFLFLNIICYLNFSLDKECQTEPVEIDPIPIDDFDLNTTIEISKPKHKFPISKSAKLKKNKETQTHELKIQTPENPIAVVPPQISKPDDEKLSINMETVIDVEPIVTNGNTISVLYI